MHGLAISERDRLRADFVRLAGWGDAGERLLAGDASFRKYFRLIESGMERARALSETCEQQMRPVLMTCVAACVGLIPAAFSTAIGSQVQRPLAVVVVGGTLLAPVLILTVLPAALSIFSRRRPEVPTATEEMVKAD